MNRTLEAMIPTKYRSMVYTIGVLLIAVLIATIGMLAFGYLFYPEPVVADIPQQSQVSEVLELYYQKKLRYDY